MKGLKEFFIGKKLEKQPETYDSSAYFAPPWSPGKNEEKTEGWVAFQQALRDDPEYYLKSFIEEHYESDCL